LSNSCGLQLAAAQTVTKVTVQASVNDGKTWTSAAVTGSAGTYHARYTAPGGRRVTPRAPGRRRRWPAPACVQA